MGLLDLTLSREGTGVTMQLGHTMRWGLCAGRAAVLNWHLPTAFAEQLIVPCCLHGSQGKYFNILISASSSRVSKTEHGNESLDFQARTTFFFLCSISCLIFLKVPENLWLEKGEGRAVSSCQTAHCLVPRGWAHGKSCLGAGSQGWLGSLSQPSPGATVPDTRRGAQMPPSSGL